MRLRVYVPYVRLSAHTQHALAERQPGYVETPGDFGYIDALEWMWNQGEGFILVEQDKVPTEDQLAELERCPEPWCCYPCRTNAGTYSDFPSLSTVRFSREMVELHPGFMEQVRQQAIGDTPAGHYSRLDMAVFTYAVLGCNTHPHWHQPEVTHIHEEGEVGEDIWGD